MSLRKIFLAPFMVKKSSPIFKQYLCTYHVSYAENIANNNNKPFSIENTNVDKLTAELDNLSSSKILNALENNQNLINGSHLVFAMNKFYKMSKRKLLSHKDGNRIWNNPEVDKMCSVIDLNVYKLSASESVKLLDTFRKMKAPSSMKVIQSLLKHINDSTKDLAFVDFYDLSLILKYMSKSTLTTNLHSNIARKFIIKVATEYDPNNIDHLQTALSFTVHNLNNNKLLKLFIDGLNNYEGEISVNTAIDILQSLSTMKEYPLSCLKLIKKIENILIEQFEDLSVENVMYTLFLISQQSFTYGKNQFYNEVFCDLAVKKIIKDDTGFENAISALKSLAYLRFVNTELLNYACATYFERKNISNDVIRGEVDKLLVLINGLGVIKHKNVFFDEIKDCLLNNKSLLDYNYETLCFLALNLIILDCYPTELLTKIFDFKYNYKEERCFAFWTFCKIYQIIKTNPTYKGPLPSESKLIALRKFYYHKYLQKKKKIDDKVLCYLEEGMGAPIYVKSTISSKLFHLIDYVVAFNKDGTPIPINTATNIDGNFKSIEYIEDLKVPPGSQIVLILLMPDFWFTRNTKELYTSHVCTIETLEALSYPVVYINEECLDESPSEEITALLMSKIRSKLVYD